MKWRKFYYLVLNVNLSYKDKINIFNDINNEY